MSTELAVPSVTERVRFAYMRREQQPPAISADRFITTYEALCVNHYVQQMIPKPRPVWITGEEDTRHQLEVFL